MSDRSLYEMFHRVCTEHADNPAYVFKLDGRWHTLTWKEHEATVIRISKALMALGVAPGERVCVLSDTRLEWVQSDFGIHSCGGVTVGIYPSNLPEDCAYIINHCDAETIIIENRAQLDKILSVRSSVPKMRNLVVMDGPGDPGNQVLSWTEFLAGGDTISDEAFADRVAGIQPGDLASLVYTSGTTGVPKGAMITHRNLLFTSESAGKCMQILPGDVTLLFLPLAHVFARIIVYSGVAKGINTAFAEGMHTVAENLREIRPHYIASVPRVFEKVHAKITQGVQQAGGIKEKLFNWALGVGRQVSTLKQNDKPIPGFLSFKYSIATKLVFQKIHAAMGGRMRWAVSGAAPLSKQIAEFFHACGILILEGLGMTENTSFTNVNRFDNNKFGTVGPVGPGIEMKISDDGEILFRGDNVMTGYFKNPEATKETIDEDGWLYTGDLGEIDDDGFLKITGRKKRLIITSGGKNIAPERIEQALCNSAFISQAMAYGDKRKYVVALVTLDSDAVAAWAAERKVAGEAADLAGHPEVRALIDGEVEKANEGLASFESVKYVRIVSAEFSIEAGELTPSLKIKAQVVAEKYRHLIEEMYED
jgi:long-chain acyl-CoA synthetase